MSGPRLPICHRFAPLLENTGAALSVPIESRHSHPVKLNPQAVVSPVFNRRLSAGAAGLAVAVFACLPPAAGVAATPGTAKLSVVPHRAIYRLSLLTARNSSPVVDATGRMMFQWTDACDAWAVEQHFRLNFLYAEGDEVTMTTNYATWEAKSGASYHFTVRKTVNGQLDEELKGDAKPDPAGKGAIVHLVKPDADDIHLPPGTLYPTGHTMVMLEQALAGDRLVSRTVYDGADVDGPTEINAVIGKRAMLKGGLAAGIGAKDRPSREVLRVDAKRETHLLAGAAWPVRLAFFPTKSDSAAPEYEMSMLLLHNGIAESMQIDYGDFTVNAVLETLEPLPKPHC